MKTLSLYIHIPFCEQKCYYCDFCSKVSTEEKKTYYVNLLIEEMALYQKYCSDYTIKTIFIGGGTPSCLPNQCLKQIFDAIKSNFNIQSLEEFTIEANPESLNNEFLDAIQLGGVNRLSIGIQSFHDSVLKTIGRIHSADEAYNAVILAKKNGLKNINIDLMYGLPNQSLDNHLESLKIANTLDIQHISAYNLIVEEKTALNYKLNHNLLTPCDEEVQVAMMEETKNLLKNFGFMQYEVSNFSKPYFECKHNMVYWNRQNYLGLGLSSHSFIDENKNAFRFSNSNQLKHYELNIKSQKIFTKKEVLTINEQKFEMIMLGLRLTNGFSISEFNKKFKSDFLGEYQDVLNPLLNKDLIIVQKDNISLTNRGFMLQNQVLIKFLE